MEDKEDPVTESLNKIALRELDDFKSDELKEGEENENDEGEDGDQDSSMLDEDDDDDSRSRSGNRTYLS